MCVSWFGLKTKVDGFSRFGLKTGGFGFPGLGLITGSYVCFLVWASNTSGQWFVSFCNTLCYELLSHFSRTLIK
jgi:hypothetical protein